MNQLQLFNHPEFGGVRVITIDNEPYFVGTDVANALGYTNPQKALRDHVPGKYKRTERIVHPSGGAQDTIVISEAGLYKLVMRSKLPNAEKFSDWVCEEVLPSIRKTGMYIDPRAEITSEMLRRMADAIDARDKKIAVLNTQVAELQPKASYYDIVLQCKDLVTTSAIAKDYGYSAKKFNKLLYRLGVQYPQSGMWLLYQKYASLGWSSTKTHKYVGIDGEFHCKVHTYWTQKGRLGLYQLLKNKGYLPTIELAA